MFDNIKDTKNANKDPVNGEPSAHPIGTGIAGVAGGVGGAVGGAVLGAAGAVAAGAVMGSTVGPLGTILGAIAGILGGAAVGKSAGEAINPTDEDAYWEKNHSTRSYIDKNADYKDYQNAYHYGTAAANYTNEDFDTVEDKLKIGWVKVKGNSNLTWDQAKEATRDAYYRGIRLHDDV